MRRAFELAQTGDYVDSAEIESFLTFQEHFLEAPQWLALRAVRRELDCACADARTGKACRT
jgi:hypothetical protein